MRSQIAETPAGSVEGEVLEDQPVAVFRGVPYAEAPTGERRFAPPVPVAPWPGVRAATRWGLAAPQPTGGPFGGLVPGMEPGAIGEDCLSVTVWAPTGDGGGARPVLVWIHGGAYQIGSSSLATYDGARLSADEGVVVVSVNYRLGALGFLDLRRHGGEAIGAVTNAGLLDQILALRWVRDHIAAFGGDPSRVTVFGESAGAGSILHLLGSGRLEGVVQRAIVQSPGVHMTLDADQGEAVAAALLARVGVAAAEIGKLTSVPWEELVEAQSAALMDVYGLVGSMPFHPVIDGGIVPRSPVADGPARGFDLILGGTSEEMRLFRDPRAKDASRDALVEMLEEHLRGHPVRALGVPADRAGTLVDAYLADQGSASEASTAILTDSTMRLPAMQAADGHTGGAGRTFSYLFTWQAPGLGAFHAVDLPFTFGTLDREGWGPFVGADADAERLSAAMRQAWAAFAATGDPSCGRLGTWPGYDLPARHSMELGRRCGPIEDPHGDIRRRWLPGQL